MTDKMDINFWAPLGAAGVAGIFGLLVARFSKSSDIRVAAESALWGGAGAIIKEQNTRINVLQTEINRLWSEVQRAYTAEQDCRNTLSEQRHANRDLSQKIIALEQRLNNLEKKDG